MFVFSIMLTKSMMSITVNDSTRNKTKTQRLPPQWWIKYSAESEDFNQMFYVHDYYLHKWFWCYCSVTSIQSGIADTLNILQYISD